MSYGYSLPIGRQFNIDFTLGVGYLSGDYMKYQPEDNCYVWESTRKRKWFGPTKAEVSLVWYIGGRNELKEVCGDAFLHYNMEHVIGINHAV